MFVTLLLVIENTINITLSIMEWLLQKKSSSCISSPSKIGAYVQTVVVHFLDHNLRLLLVSHFAIVVVWPRHQQKWQLACWLPPCFPIFWWAVSISSEFIFSSFNIKTFCFCFQQDVFVVVFFKADILIVGCQFFVAFSHRLRLILPMHLTVICWLIHHCNSIVVCFFLVVDFAVFSRPLEPNIVFICFLSICCGRVDLFPRIHRLCHLASSFNPFVLKIGMC